jgi:vancomycin resistance protein VanJ
VKAVRAVAADRDIVALEELTGDAMTEVRRTLGERYPHHYTVGTVGLWSRYPLRDATRVDVGLGWPRALRAVVQAGKADVTVYVMHLASARPGETTRRDETLAAAEKMIAKDSSRRLLLLGDLNTATTDRHRQGLVPPLTDAQQAAGEGFGFTWPSKFPITRPDHILYRGLDATTAGVEKAPGSDHRAAVAQLRL